MGTVLLLGILGAAGCPTREEIGVLAAPRGLVCGALWIMRRMPSDASKIDADLSEVGSREVLIDQELHSAARLYIRSKQNKVPTVLVVEKASIFRVLQKALAEADLLKELVLVTGGGQPDLATRRLLHRLIKENEWSGGNFAYLGDWDPHGLLIYLTYRDGPTGTNHVLGAQDVGE